MSLKGILIVAYLDLLIPLAVFINIYLYFYPVFHFCSFHSPPDGTPAPFRLLALADPQLEGDTTLRRYASQHKPDDPLLSYLDPAHLSRDFHRVRKTIDLWGNDLYLAHIYRTMRRHLGPTHTVVLGDLIGSQWIGDEEFEKRGDRFWKIFNKGSKVAPEDITAGTAVGSDWRDKVITLPGNHDIGYAGDMNRGRIDRFESMFGPVNYALDFKLPDNESFAESELAPSLKIVVLNSMTLDEPITDPSLRDDSYAFIDRVQESSGSKQATVLLTHLPFYKPAGVCVDPPFFTYFAQHHGGGIKEQNHLSEGTSERVLSSFFGAEETRGVILTGHDHEGCDVRHSRMETKNDGAGGWNATRWELPAAEGIREVTVQSMMGGYGGNAGLVSAWWDKESDSWKFEYSTCALGTQYVWWAVHVVDVICMLAGLILFSAHNRSQAKNLEKAEKMQEELERKEKKVA